MICLDNMAAVAAFQQNPLANIAVHRARVRAFLLDHFGLRIMFPTVAFSEYLWKAGRSELEQEIRRVVGGAIFTPAFDETTAELAANIGRRYAAGRGLGDVARQIGTDRIALKADLQIVATALQHSAQYFLTGDPGCHAVALFAGLTSFDISALPDPPPPRQILPPITLRRGTQPVMFEDEDDELEGEEDEEV